MGARPVAPYPSRVHVQTVASLEIADGPERRRTGDELEREAKAAAGHDADELLVMFLGKPIKMRIYGSRLFDGYSGIGIFNLYNTSGDVLQSTDVFDLSLKGDTRFIDVQRKLASMLGFKREAWRCQLFRYDVLAGLQGRAAGKPSDDSTLARETVSWPQMQYWLLILPASFGDATLPLATWNEAQSLDTLTLPEPPPEPAPVSEREREREQEREREREQEQEREAASQPEAQPESQPAGVSSLPEAVPVASENASSLAPADTRSTERSETRQGSEQQATASERDGANASEDAAMPDATDAATAAAAAAAADANPAPREGDVDRSGHEMEVETTPPAVSAAAPDPAPLPRPQSERAHRHLGPRSRRHSRFDGLLNASILVFVKRFDVRAQTLAGVGGCLVGKAEPMDTSIRQLLGLPHDQRIRLWEEVSPLSVREISSGQSFRDERLVDGAIVVVGDVMSEEE